MMVLPRDSRKARIPCLETTLIHFYHPRNDRERDCSVVRRYEGRGERVFVRKTTHKRRLRLDQIVRRWVYLRSTLAASKRSIYYENQCRCKGCGVRRRAGRSAVPSRAGGALVYLMVSPLCVWLIQGPVDWLPVARFRRTVHMNVVARVLERPACISRWGGINEPAPVRYGRWSRSRHCLTCCAPFFTYNRSVSRCEKNVKNSHCDDAAYEQNGRNNKTISNAATCVRSGGRGKKKQRTVVISSQVVRFSSFLSGIFSSRMYCRLKPSIFSVIQFVVSYDVTSSICNRKLADTTLFHSLNTFNIHNIAYNLHRVLQGHF